MRKMMERCMRFMQEDGCSGRMESKFRGPKEMFRHMKGHFPEDDRLAEYGTRELRILFQDWLLQLEEEIIGYAKDRRNVTPEDVASAFGISRESATFLLSKLAKNEKINISGI